MSDVELPAWVEALRSDASLTTDLGLRWLTDDDAADRRAAHLAAWAGVPYAEDFHLAGCARLERSTPLALGPVRERRLHHTPIQMVLWLDPEAPDHPWISLAEPMPPQAWARGATTTDALRRALRPYLIAGDPAPVELPRCERLVKLIELDDHAVFQRLIAEIEPWLDDATWGSAHDDDPWAGWRRDLGMIDLAHAGRDAARVHPGRFPTLGCRTLWSRSVIRIERHPLQLWVFEIRYAPAHDEPVIAALNELLGLELPLDLPVDVAASLLRDVTASPAEIAARQDDDLHHAALALASAPGETTSFALLERWLARADGNHALTGEIAQLAMMWGHFGLVHELAATLPDGELRDALIAELRPGNREEAAA